MVGYATNKGATGMLWRSRYSCVQEDTDVLLGDAVGDWPGTFGVFLMKGFSVDEERTQSPNTGSDLYDALELSLLVLMVY